MTNPAPLACDLCGRTGVVYLIDGRPYCPSCMYKKHPPLEYEGPDRRGYAPRSSPFTRRSEDQRKGSGGVKPPRR